MSSVLLFPYNVGERLGSFLKYRKKGLPEFPGTGIGQVIIIVLGAVREEGGWESAWKMVMAPWSL